MTPEIVLKWAGVIGVIVSMLMAISSNDIWRLFVYFSMSIIIYIIGVMFTNK